MPQKEIFPAVSQKRHRAYACSMHAEGNNQHIFATLHGLLGQ